jgi:hypothetical protein
MCGSGCCFFTRCCRARRPWPGARRASAPKEVGSEASRPGSRTPRWTMTSVAGGRSWSALNTDAATMILNVALRFVSVIWPRLRRLSPSTGKCRRFPPGVAGPVSTPPAAAASATMSTLPSSRQSQMLGVPRQGRATSVPAPTWMPGFQRRAGSTVSGSSFTAGTRAPPTVPSCRLPAAVDLGR